MKVAAHVARSRGPRLQILANRLTGAVFAVTSAAWVYDVLRGDALANDALVYRAGAAAFVAGGDPWSAGYHGWTFAAPPLQALIFAPAALVPVPVFVAFWTGLSVIAAIAIVRRIGLPAWWVAYPPLILGVALGNPSVVGMGVLLVGGPLVGVILRPQLLPVVSPRTIAMFGGLSLVVVALRPDFLTGLAETLARYQAESGAPVNFWLHPLAIPALAALALLWRVDRHAARWLLMPAVGPAMGWYGFAMVLPVASVPLAVACAVPIPGLGAAAITAYATIRWCRERGSEQPG